MAFNLLNIGYDGTVASSFADLSTRQSDGDNNDIFYYIGTNFGSSSWSNPSTTSYLTLGALGNTNTSSVVGIVDNNLGDNGAFNGNNNNTSGSVTFEFNDLVVSPNGIQLGVYSSQVNNDQYLIKDIALQASVDNVNWVTLTTIPDFYPVVTNQEWAPYLSFPEQGFFKYLRLNFNVINGFATVRISEAKLYGRLKTTNNQQVSRVSLPVTLEQLPDVDIISPQDGDYLYWAQGIVKHQREKLYETVRTTDNIILSDNQFLPNFYIVTPSNNTTVDLPSNPIAGQFFRFKNLNNTLELQIREPVAIVVATLGGANGPGLTQADCYYDGTEWNIITY